MRTFYPGTELVVFDPSLYVDDIKTPLSITLQRATVVCWYGQRANKLLGDYVYPSLIDVRLRRNGKISRGHFTDCIREVINTVKGKKHNEEFRRNDAAEQPARGRDS